MRVGETLPSFCVQWTAKHSMKYLLHQLQLIPKQFNISIPLSIPFPPRKCWHHSSIQLIFQFNYQFIHSRIAARKQICQHKCMGLGSISNNILKDLFNLLPHYCRFDTISVGDAFYNLFCG